MCSEGVLNRFDYERLIIEDIRKRYLKLNEIDSKIIPLSSGRIRKKSLKNKLHPGFRPGVQSKISKYRGDLGGTTLDCIIWSLADTH